MHRGTIFISHATPDDNDFVRWLGMRLTGHGYKVWADLFELKGGTPFWSSIEETLRHQACKVIFVASKKSVGLDRTGVRNELSVADAMKTTLRDPGFIIPVKIDDTAFSELPIQVHQLDAIDFAKGGGPKLVELLATLEDANVPRFVGDQTSEFEKWRATMARTSTIVATAPEPVLTNLLPIASLPANITFFEHQEDNTKIAAELKSTGIPHAHFYRLVVSFAELSTIQEALPPSLSLKVRARIPFTAFLDGAVTDVTSPQRDEARKIATSLLRQHVERYLEQRGLKRFETSSGPSFYFPSGLIPNDKVPYVAASGRKTNKNVVGRSERNKVNWHLAMKVNVALGPPAMVRFKPYVCFSEDGQTAINDPKRTSAIRRRFCKNWWNQHWRQLQEAFCVFLADGKEAAEISLGGPEKLVLASRLLELMVARKMPDDRKAELPFHRARQEPAHAVLLPVCRLHHFFDAGPLGLAQECEHVLLLGDSLDFWFVSLQRRLGGGDSLGLRFNRSRRFLGVGSRRRDLTPGCRLRFGKQMAEGGWPLRHIFSARKASAEL